MFKIRGSWKTTISGIAAVVGVICLQVVNLLDDNPATTFDLSAVISAFSVAATGLGLLFARDDDVSSEESGAKTKGKVS